ncbi:transmembrane protein, putative (macronuclear) [Tetrahymena thermophila SB210]|uniref:Transmembrane protein, putative n=1 Tax=Tetrahymena thermophila (strain SB210) TaxID=312017 RepID=Q23HB4_TETTS|nr:transmembrane protein, putative [Tetrahymena thermophila SB210]EAR95894.1 transmembrane protein, putative [Tetrahymena thermophila SB210]|eukprot:XP_001016139.1 transmembrane protein, putative [Tetrahymena thermophila SB210]
MKLVVFLLFVALVAANSNDEVPQCAKDLANNLQSGKVCKEGDTDCINALKSLKTCLDNCQGQSTTQQQGIQCVQSQCKSSNPTVQSFVNDLIKCANYSLITVFSMLFALIYIMI